ncbi:hypothetical protein D3C86_1759850 [compost metagenome]
MVPAAGVFTWISATVGASIKQKSCVASVVVGVPGSVILAAIANLTLLSQFVVGFRIEA